jgi:lipopolysaccharide export system protein LptC
MIRQFFWFLLVLAGCVTLYAWLGQQEQTKPAASNELAPDFIAYDLIRTSFDEDGNLTGMVRASQMSHFEQLGQIQLDQPAYTIFELHLPKWQISSRSGVLYPDDKVVLNQDVTLDNLKSDELFQKLETPLLEYQFDQQLLLTNAGVLISGDGFAITGRGVIIDLESKKFKLKQHKGTVYRHEK